MPKKHVHQPTQTELIQAKIKEVNEATYEQKLHKSHLDIFRTMKSKYQPQNEFFPFPYQFRLTDETASTSTITGALQVIGGMGIQGSIYGMGIYNTETHSDEFYGQIKTATQNSITSVGTLDSLQVTGNITAANLELTETFNLDSMIISGNLRAGGFDLQPNERFNFNISGNQLGYFSTTEGFYISEITTNAMYMGVVMTMGNDKYYKWKIGETSRDLILESGNDQHYLINRGDTNLININMSSTDPSTIFNHNVTINDTTGGTSKDSGSLVLNGGLGMENNITANKYFIGDFGAVTRNDIQLSHISRTSTSDYSFVATADGETKINAMSSNSVKISNAGTTIADFKSSEVRLSSSMPLYVDSTDNFSGSDGAINSKGGISLNGDIKSQIMFMGKQAGGNNDTVVFSHLDRAGSSSSYISKSDGTTNIQATSSKNINMFVDSSIKATFASTVTTSTNPVEITDTTSSTSSTTGALKVSGGISSEDDIWVGSDKQINVGTTSNSVSISSNENGGYITINGLSNNRRLNVVRSTDSTSDVMSYWDTSNKNFYTNNNLTVVGTLSAGSIETEGAFTSNQYFLAYSESPQYPGQTELSHQNRKGGNEFSFISKDDGETIVNANGNSQISMKITDTYVMTIDNTNIISYLPIRINSSVESTSKTTGSIILNGGIGMTGNLFCNRANVDELFINNVFANAVGGTISDSAQPNITSLGTLVDLTVDNIHLNGSTIGLTSDNDLLTLGANTLTVSGDVVANNILVNNIAINGIELNAINDTISGTLIANKALVVDGNKHINELYSTALYLGPSGSATQVTATASELNILDGTLASTQELNTMNGSQAGIVVNSKAVIYGSGGELAGILSNAVQPNITSVGTLTELTIDNIHINGSTIGLTSDDSLISLTTNTVSISGNLVVESLHIGDQNVNLSELELDAVNNVVAGTLTASKALIADSNQSIDAVKTQTLYLGSSGSETQVTANADELNYLDISSLGVSQNSKVLTQNANGEVTIGQITINSSRATIGHINDSDLMTLADGVLTVAGNIITNDLVVTGNIMVSGNVDGVNISALSSSAIAHNTDTGNPHSVTATQIGLGNVEDTAVSTWGGATTIDTVGTVTTGTWNATSINENNFDFISATEEGSGASSDYLLLYDNGDTTNKRISLSNLSSFFSGGGGGGAVTGGTYVNFEVEQVLTVGTDNAGGRIDLKNGNSAAGYMDIYEDGNNPNDYRLRLQGQDTLTADRLLRLPDNDGTIITDNAGGISNEMLQTIADSKLSTISTADKVSLTALNIDGGTSMTAGTLADADLFIVDDGASGTNRTATMGDVITHVTDHTSLTSLGSLVTVGTLTSLTVDNIIVDGTTIGHTSDTDLLTLASGALTVAGTIGCGTVTGTGNIVLSSDSSSISLGVGNNVTVTHDGITGVTLAANPITLDSGGDIILDADGADIILKDGGTTFGSLTDDGSNNLLIKSGTTPTQVLTFSGANTIFAGSLGRSDDTDLITFDSANNMTINSFLKVHEVDTAVGATLRLGKATATKVEIGAIDITTEIRGDVDLSTHDGITSGLHLDGILVTANALQLNYTNIDSLGVSQNGRVLTQNANGEIVLNQVFINSSVGYVEAIEMNATTELTANHITANHITTNTITSYGTLTVGTGNIVLSSDSSSISLGDGNDVTITHDGTTGVTLAANPITLDSGGDIILDADGADIILKDGGTTFGSLTDDGSNNLLIKSGTTQVLTFSGANTIFAGSLGRSDDTDLVTFDSTENMTINSFLKVHEIDTAVVGATLRLGKSTATKVEVGAIDITTEIKGDVDLSTHDGITSGLHLDGLLVTANALQLNYTDIDSLGVSQNGRVLTQNANGEIVLNQVFINSSIGYVEAIEMNTTELTGNNITANHITTNTITSYGVEVIGHLELNKVGSELEFNTGGPRLRTPAANVLTIHTGGGIGTSSDRRVTINSTEFAIDQNTFKFGSARTITNEDDSGELGQICFNSSFIFVCVASGEWKRAAISTW
jgi:hypothetical protein